MLLLGLVFIQDSEEFMLQNEILQFESSNTLIVDQLVLKKAFLNSAIQLRRKNTSHSPIKGGDRKSEMSGLRFLSGKLSRRYAQVPSADFDFKPFLQFNWANAP